MTIGAIGGLPAQHVIPSSLAPTGAEKAETGPDHDGDGDDAGGKVSPTASASSASGAGRLVNLLA